MNFLIIDGRLLKNRTLTSLDKLIISVIWNLKKANKKFFGTSEYLANEVGSDAKLIDRQIDKMEGLGILLKEKDGITLATEFEEIINFAIVKENMILMEHLSKVLIDKYKL